jgi:hypothetical protein
MVRSSTPPIIRLRCAGLTIKGGQKGLGDNTAVSNGQFSCGERQSGARAADLDGLVRAVAEGRCRCLLALTEIDGLRLLSGIRKGAELRSFVGSIAERLIVRFPTSTPIIGFTSFDRRGGRKFMGNLSFRGGLLPWSWPEYI